MKPVIAVDLDEVLGYFVQSISNYYNEVYGTTLTMADYFSYEFRYVWKCDNETSIRIVHDYFESRHFVEGIEVVDGSYTVLSKLKEKYDFHIVTSRQHVIEEATILWISKNFPGIFTKVHFGNHYGLTGGKRSKSEMCRDIGAIALIDDSLKYALECASDLPHIVLFGNYGWNQTEEPLPENVARLTNWDEVKVYLETLI